MDGLLFLVCEGDYSSYDSEFFFNQEKFVHKTECQLVVFLGELGSIAEAFNHNEFLVGTFDADGLI
jgi:hypothetical protein